MNKAKKLPARFISDMIDNEQCAHFSPMLRCSSANERRNPALGGGELVLHQAGCRCCQKLAASIRSLPNKNRHHQPQNNCAPFGSNNKNYQWQLKFILALSHFSLLSHSPSLMQSSCASLQLNFKSSFYVLHYLTIYSTNWWPCILLQF